MIKKRHLPNFLTLSRIIAVPLLVGAFYMRGDLHYWLAAGLFAYASATDFLDGYLARAWDAKSNVGRFLDPIADKLLVAAALVLLVEQHRAHIIPTLLILSREILVSGLREFLMELRVPMPVSTLAKYKTALQMLAIFLLLLGRGAPHWLPANEVGAYLLWVAALLTVVTGYAYLRTGLKHM